MAAIQKILSLDWLISLTPGGRFAGLHRSKVSQEQDQVSKQRVQVTIVASLWICQENALTWIRAWENDINAQDWLDKLALIGLDGGFLHILFRKSLVGSSHGAYREDRA
jgi:hypothetical protein